MTFLDNRHMKVSRLSAQAPAAFNPQEISLVLTAVTGSVDPRARVRQAGELVLGLLNLLTYSMVQSPS